MLLYPWGHGTCPSFVSSHAATPAATTDPAPNVTAVFFFNAVLRCTREGRAD